MEFTKREAISVRRPEEWSFGKDNSCPTSTHRKKQHLGVTQSREKAYSIFTKKDGSTMQSKFPTYFDQVTCKFCGATHEQEWMPM